MEEYAEKNDLLYINFLELQEEIGIDWNTDTYDTGLHLNVYGAEKLSKYFGRILSDDCGIKDRREDTAVNDLWKDKVTAYKERKAYLESIPQTK